MTSTKLEKCQGKFYQDCICNGKIFEPGSIFNYSFYLPQNMPQEGAALYVLLEHTPQVMSPMLEGFVEEGIMPSGMFLFINSGILPSTFPNGAERKMRAEEFDQYGPEFTDLLIHELVPQAEEIAGIRLSRSPDMWMISGGSSGGMAAWNSVWFRNNSFRRAFLSSPTFSAMRGGEEPMMLVRKTESRPMRLYVTTGTCEPDYFFGNSFYAACNAKRAFEFANYDFRFELFPGEGHCCRRENPALLRRIMTFLWRNWQTTPVCAPGNQIRIDHLLTPGSVWEETVEPMPGNNTVVKMDFGTYSFCGGKIFLTTDKDETLTVANGFGSITALALSSDNWRLYVADSSRRFVYALTIQQDGSLSQCYKLAPLHLAHDCRIIGARDLCAAENDRIFAATELGIQGIVSFGLTDLILPLPNDLPADRVALAGNLLYAASGSKVFRRPLKISAKQAGVCKSPSTPNYSNGFDYSLPHLPQ